jgi:hypothetical protein
MSESVITTNQVMTRTQLSVDQKIAEMEGPHCSSIYTKWDARGVTGTMNNPAALLRVQTKNLLLGALCQDMAETPFPDKDNDYHLSLPLEPPYTWNSHQQGVSANELRRGQIHDQ